MILVLEGGDDITALTRPHGRKQGPGCGVSPHRRPLHPRARVAILTAVTETHVAAAEPATSSPPHGAGAAILTLGFAGAVGMWALGYVGRLPGLLELPPAFLGVGFLAAFLAVGVVAGRRLGSVGAGGAAGAVAGAINVMIFLSARQGVGGAVAVAGSIGAGALLGALGAALGRRGHAPAREPSTTWAGRFGAVAATATLLLLAVGGLVTSHDAGLAVPDWPNTYGSNMFLFPLERMTGGIYYEHAHRLFGALVGLTTMTYMALVLATDERRAVKGLAVLAFALVVTQGVLGGLRVTGKATLSADAAQLAPNLTLAVVHGVLGQLFFAVLLALAALTSRTWRQAAPPSPRDSGETDLALAGWFVAAVAVQLLLGALLRHFHMEASWHISMAVVVLTLGGFTGVRAWGYHADLPILPRLGLALAALLCAQLFLGIAALVVTTLERPAGERVRFEIPIATAHQTIGAMILGAAVLVRLWTGRLVAPAPETAAP